MGIQRYLDGLKCPPGINWHSCVYGVAVDVYIPIPGLLLSPPIVELLVAINIPQPLFPTVAELHGAVAIDDGRSEPCAFFQLPDWQCNSVGYANCSDPGATAD